MAEVIEWDAPLNDEEDIEWENNLTKDTPTTPYQLQKAKSRPVATAGIVTDVPNYSPQEIAAAEQGVDVDTGMQDQMGQVGLGFSGNPEEQKMYLEQRLSQAYKQPVRVRIGPQSGMPEFLSPKTQKWVAVKASSLGTGVIDAVGGGLGAIGGVLGGAAVGGVPGAIGLGIAGAGAGGGLAEAAKLGIGKAIGAVDPNYPIGSDVGEAAIDAAAWEAGTLGALGAAKWGRYWFKGARAFAPKEAAALAESAAKADRVIKDIQQMSGREFSPTLGQRLDEGAMQTPSGQLALQHEAGIAKDPRVSPKLSALHQANEDALATAFDNASSPFAIRAADGAAQLSAQDANQNVIKGLTQEYDSVMDNARKIVAQLPEDVPASEAGAIMRAALVKADKAFKTSVEDPAWAKYRDGTGYNPKTFSSKVRVPWDDRVRALMSSWDSRSREAILKAVQNDNSGLRILFKEEVTPAAKVLGPDGLPWKEGSRNAIEDVDLAVLDDTIKWLRSDARDALKNQVGVTYNTRDLSQLEKTLTSMRDDYLKESRPELFGMLQEAEGASRLRAAQFKSKAMKDLMIKDGPDGFRMSDDKAVYHILNTNNTSAARQFNALTKGDPEAAQEARHMIYALYRQEVVNPKTGAPNPTLHTKFMRKYGQIANEFFRPEDHAVLKRMGGMGTAIAKEEAAIKKLVPQINKLFGGELESLNAQRLSQLTATSSPEKIKLATGMLKRSGQEGLVEEWQHAVLDDLGKTLIKDGQVNSGQLMKLLNGNNRATLETLLNSGGMGRGTQYIKNLETINEALTMVRTQGKGAIESQAKGLFVRLARMFIPPFSTEGRIVTFGAGSRTKAVPGEIYKAITDPAELTKLANQAKTTMSQIRKTAGVGAVGNYLSDSNY